MSESGVGYEVLSHRLCTSVIVSPPQCMTIRVVFFSSSFNVSHTRAPCLSFPTFLEKKVSLDPYIPAVAAIHPPRSHPHGGVAIFVTWRRTSTRQLRIRTSPYYPIVLSRTSYHVFIQGEVRLNLAGFALISSSCRRFVMGSNSGYHRLRPRGQAGDRCHV